MIFFSVLGERITSPRHLIRRDAVAGGIGFLDCHLKKRSVALEPASGLVCCTAEAGAVARARTGAVAGHNRSLSLQNLLSESINCA
jgi:hypothetical protein